MGCNTRDYFKANLKYYRKQKGLSQEKLSEIIGFGITYISEIESRKKFPRPETIDLIAQNLSIEPYQLFVPPEAREKTIVVTEQTVVNSVPEKLSSHFGTMLHDRIQEDIVDIMAKENLMLVQRVRAAR